MLTVRVSVDAQAEDGAVVMHLILSEMLRGGTYLNAVRQAVVHAPAMDSPRHLQAPTMPAQPCTETS